MVRRLATSLIVLAGLAWACGDQLPESNDGNATADGGDGSSVDSGSPGDDASSASSDALVDGVSTGCTAPGFCVGFETNDVFKAWEKSEGSGGVVSITNTNPQEGVGALHSVASGGSGQAIAAVSQTVNGDFKSFDCTMWLRAPNGWEGSYEALSIETTGAVGFSSWRVKLAVATNKAVVEWQTTNDASVDGNMPSTGGAIATPQTAGWVPAHLSFSKAGAWTVTGKIGASSVSVQAPDPTVVHDPKFVVGLARAAYASSPPALGFALDVDDLRCAITK